MADLRLIVLVVLTLLLGCREPLTIDLTGGETPRSTGQTGVDAGCITVDCEGGYAWINDAIAAAEEGSIIQLCDNSHHAEEVWIDKGVTLLGPGSDRFMIETPARANGITITASGVRIEGITVQAGLSGFSILADDVHLRDVVVSDSGGWGVEAKAAAGLVIANATISGNKGGGVFLEGGEAEILDSEVSSNLRHGLWVTQGGEATVTRSTVQRTSPDILGLGYGVRVEGGSTLSSKQSAFLDNANANLYVTDSNLTMDGDIVFGSLVGVAALNGSVDLTSVEVTNGFNHGIYAQTSEPITLIGVEVHGDPALTADIPSEEWGGEAGTFAGSGLYLIANDMYIADSRVAGYNNAGLVLRPLNEGDEAVAVLDKVTLANNSRLGAFVEQVELQATNLEVTGLLSVDTDTSRSCSAEGTPAAVHLMGGEAHFLHGSITNNQGFGIFGNQAQLWVEGTSFADNHCASLYHSRGGAVVTGADFRGPGRDLIRASIYDRESLTGTVVSNSTFRDGFRYYVHEREWSCGTKICSYRQTSPSGVDISINSGARFESIGNHFINGTNGIVLDSTAGRIIDNEFSNYASDPIWATESVIEVVGLRVDGFGGFALNIANQSSLILRDALLLSGGAYRYTFQSYVDGALLFTGDTSAYGAAISTSNSDLWASDLQVSNILTTGLAVGAGAHQVVEVRNSTFTDIAQEVGDRFYALRVSIDDPTAEVRLEDVSLTGTPHGGLSVSAWEGDSEPLRMVATRIKIEDVGASAVVLSGEGLMADLASINVSKAGAFGLHADGVRSVSLTDSTIHATGAAGAYIHADALTLRDNTITGSGTYGVECVDLTEATCADNDLSGNAIADQLGCDAVCTLP